MLAPQSDDEIRPIEQKLQELDPMLSIRWNPRSVVIPSKTFDVYGLAKAPTFLARWEVMRRNADGRLDVVYVVRFDGDGDDRYRPIGWWLVEWMQRWDSTQSHYRDQWAKAWAEHDRAELAAVSLDDAELAQFLDEQAFNINGPTWIGRGLSR